MTEQPDAIHEVSEEEESDEPILFSFDDPIFDNPDENDYDWLAEILNADDGNEAQVTESAVTGLPITQEQLHDLLAEAREQGVIETLNYLDQMQAQLRREMRLNLATVLASIDFAMTGQTNSMAGQINQELRQLVLSGEEIDELTLHTLFLDNLPPSVRDVVDLLVQTHTVNPDNVYPQNQEDQQQGEGENEGEEEEYEYSDVEDIEPVFSNDFEKTFALRLIRTIEEINKYVNQVMADETISNEWKEEKIRYIANFATVVLMGGFRDHPLDGLADFNELLDILSAFNETDEGPLYFQYTGEDQQPFTFNGNTEFSNIEQAIDAVGKIVDQMLVDNGFESNRKPKDMPYWLYCYLEVIGSPITDSLSNQHPDYRLMIPNTAEVQHVFRDYENSRHLLQNVSYGEYDDEIAVTLNEATGTAAWDLLHDEILNHQESEHEEPVSL